MKVQFSVDARKYFEVDADRGDDIVIVTIDFDRRRAEYNPANFPAEEDDFKAVLTLWERLGFPNELAEWFEIRSPFRDVRLIRSNRTGELIGLSHDAWDGEEYDGVVYSDEYTPTDIHVRIRPVTVEYRPDEYVIIDYIVR